MPSLINELLLDDLNHSVGDSSAFIVIDAAGLKADESLSLRRRLVDVGARLRVAKARLVRRAVPQDLSTHLDGSGSLAIVSGSDIAAAAKVVNELVKIEKVTLRGGLIEGKALDASGAARLADLPTKHEARALVVRAIRGPAVKLARLLKAPYRRLGRAVKAHVDKLSDA